MEETLDRLVDYFTKVDEQWNEGDGLVMGIWFLGGLRTAVAHPEWAATIVRQSYEEIGETADDDSEASAIVQALPVESYADEG